MMLSNEHKLLLLCAGEILPENQVDELKALLSLPLNWESIVHLAESRNISSLLYANLKQVNEKVLVPEEALDRLKRAYHYNTAMNMFIFTELQRILQAFHENKIDAMILKGAALAGTVYPDIGLRSMRDIDILVREDSLPLAKEVMSALSYEAQTHTRTEEWYRENHFHLPVYIHKEKSIAVEIHWKIANDSLGIDSSEWWSRALRRQLMETPILIPSPEDMVLHLCLHMYHNNYNKETGFRGLCDIAYTLDRFSKDINWKTFHAKAGKSEISKSIYSTLFLVRKHLCCNHRFLAGLEREHIDPNFITIMEKIVFGLVEDSYAAFLHTLVANTLLKKTKLLFSAVFPPQYEMSNRYSLETYSFKIYYYYLYRIGELAVKYGKCLFDIIRLQILNRGEHCRSS